MSNRDYFFGLEVTGPNEITIRCDRNALTTLFAATRQLANDTRSSDPSAATSISSCIQDCLLFQLPNQGGE